MMLKNAILNGKSGAVQAAPDEHIGKVKQWNLIILNAGIALT
jgi:hypothetical protein